MRFPIMNTKEREVYELLIKIPEIYRVFPKVRLIDILEPNLEDIDGTSLSKEEKSYALKAHCDFLIVGEDYRPLLCIEYNGLIHEVSETSIKNDKLKVNLLARAGVPALAITAKDLYENNPEGQNKLTSLIKGALDFSNQENIKDVLCQTFQKLGKTIETKLDSKESDCVCTGISRLDETINGFDKKELILFVSENFETFNSTMISGINFACSQQNKNALVFSFNTTKEKLTMAIIAHHSQLDYNRFLNGMLKEADINKLAEAATHIGNKMNITIADDIENITLESILNKIRVFQTSDNPADIVFIDSLEMIGQCLAPWEKDLAMSQLKKVARQYNIPIVVHTTIKTSNRTEKKPNYSDLPSQVGLFSDKIIGLYLLGDEINCKTNDEEELGMIVLKNNLNSQIVNHSFYFSWTKSCFNLKSLNIDFKNLGPPPVF